MANVPSREELTEDQSQALEEAAFLVLTARTQAGALLTRSGVEPPPEEGWFGSPCAGTFDDPPPEHPCGCRDYTGPGGPCMTVVYDPHGPDFGGGAADTRRRCLHQPSMHLET